MLNRVISRIVKGGALFILVTCAVPYRYVWTRWVARQRFVNLRAGDTFQYIAASKLNQETIPLAVERTSTTPPTLLRVPDATRYRTVSSLTGRVGGSLQSDPAHSLSERSSRREAGLIAFHRRPGAGDHASTARRLCAPTPYPPNVTVLGRVLEKCIPTSTSTSTPGGFTQDNIYVTVKTTQKNHNVRLRPILLTWLQTAQPDQVWLPIRVRTFGIWCLQTVCVASSRSLHGRQA